MWELLMGPVEILKLAVLLTFYFILIAGLRVMLTYKKEEMQSNLFLRYGDVKKSVVTFVISLIIFDP